VSDDVEGTDVTDDIDPAERMLEILMTTRAMRRFLPDPVPDEMVQRCLEAAQQAPSGGNIQPQQYVVVRDAEVRRRLGEIYGAAYDRYEAAIPEPEFRTEADAESYRRTRAASRHLADTIGDVPVLVAVVQPVIPWGGRDEEGPLDIGRLDASVYPAVQNLCIAARAQGLGTALTTVIRVRHVEALEALGIPADRYEISALIPIGWPSGRFGRARRKPVAAVTHYDRWGERRR
jgi:nitroreductase